MVKNRLKDQKGLTLIELLAVIVILGIVSAIAVPSILGIIENSKVDAIKSEAIQVINAGKMYVASEGVPTTTSNGTTTSGGDISGAQIEPYLEDTQLTGITLHVTADNVISISATGNTGKNTITFTKAALTDIQGSGKPENGTLTITGP